MSSFDASIIRKQLSNDDRRFCSASIIWLWFGFSSWLNGDGIDEYFWLLKAFAEDRFTTTEHNLDEILLPKHSDNMLSEQFEFVP